MSEDRFGDLGRGDSRSAAERFEEEDRLRPEPDARPRPREVRPPGNRYAWVVAIVMLMGVGVLLITTAVPNSGHGLRGPKRGAILPDFAAPLATGNIDDGDANVCQRPSECNERSGKVPACQLTSEEVFNVCEARERPLVLTFLVTEGADCEPQVDRVERMRREFPGVGFAAVVNGNDRADVERIARRRGWTLPVAVAEDGAVVNLYRVGVCPTTVFARAGGRVHKTRLGNLTEAELRTEVRGLLGTGGPRRGPRVGQVVPDFAAPLATGEIEGADANVQPASGPAGGSGSVPACEVRAKGIVNVCRLRRRPLVLTFIPAEGADCGSQVDRVERIRADFPEAAFAAVVSGQDRASVERVARRRGWGMPVAVDSDGAVANLYGAAACPTTVFAKAGGRVRKVRRGDITAGALRAEVRELLDR